MKLLVKSPQLGDIRTALPSFKGAHKKKDHVGSVAVIRQSYLVAVAGRKTEIRCGIADSNIVML